MADAGGLGLVLRRLSVFGCDPQRVADGTWIARCPVHGGPYQALLVNCDADGSATVKCRYVNHKGESCAEAEILQSLGLEWQHLERALATTPQLNGTTAQDEAREPVAAGGRDQQPVEARTGAGRREWVPSLVPSHPTSQVACAALAEATPRGPAHSRSR